MPNRLLDVYLTRLHPKRSPMPFYRSGKKKSFTQLFELLLAGSVGLKMACLAAVRSKPILGHLKAHTAVGLVVPL